MKWRATFAWGWIGIGGDRRAELALGESVEGAEAAGEFGGGQSALAVELAEKIAGGALPFLRIAFQAARDEVTVGIAPELDAGHDMVEALHRGCEPPHAVKALTALAGMNGLAQRLGLQEIGLLETGEREWQSRVVG
jgi:hypothetical protein